MTYRGCRPGILQLIKIMLVREIGIRDINTVPQVSIIKVLKVLKSDEYTIKPKRSHYDCLETDELWTYVRKKKNKVWLSYAYHRENGEIVAYVWGNREIKTAEKLKERIHELGISYELIATDNGDNFLGVFGEGGHLVGKEHTVGIEGNDCQLRHRIRKVFQRTCCFSMRLFNHLKAFDMAFFYINYGFV
jgi:IS1 family transposase